MPKDVLKNSLIYTIIGFSPLILAFIFTPIYVNYMNEKEYGILNLFILLSGIVTIILHSGVSRAFSYLYWDVYKDDIKLKELIGSTIAFLLIIQAILLSIGYFFGKPILSFVLKSDQEFSFYPYFILVMVYSFFMVYAELFQFYFRNKENLKLYSILSIGTLILFTIGNLIGVVLLEEQALGAISGRTLSYGIMVIGFLIYFINKFGLRFNLKEYKNLLYFGFPLFINGLIGAFAYGLDKLLIERFDSLETLGVYGFSVIAISVIEIFFNSINNAFVPSIYRYVTDSLETKGKVIESTVFLIILLVMLLATLIVGGFYPLMQLIIPDSYHMAIVYVPVLVCAFFWRMLVALKSISLFKEKKTKYFLFNQSSILLFMILFGYLGYQFYGVMGIVYAVYLSKLMEFLIMSYIADKVIKLPINYKNIIIMIVVLSAVCFYITKDPESFNENPFKYFIPFAVFVVSLFTILRKELREVIELVKNRKEFLQ